MITHSSTNKLLHNLCLLVKNIQLGKKKMRTNLFHGGSINCLTYIYLLIMLYDGYNINMKGRLCVLLNLYFLYDHYIKLVITKQ